MVLDSWGGATGTHQDLIDGEMLFDAMAEALGDKVERIHLYDEV